MAKVAINGFGRIGRAVFKILLETPGLECVAINDLAPIDGLAYLLNFDSIYRNPEKQAVVDGKDLVVGEARGKVSSEREPQALPWAELGVDIVIECSGVFTESNDLEGHIRAGAARVVLAAPAGDDGVKTVINGVNRAAGTERFTACASSTANAVAPVLEILERHAGVAKASMTSVHAYTSAQSLVDGYKKSARLGRAADNFVPLLLGDEAAIVSAVPALAGKLDGVTVRGPVSAGSLVVVNTLTKKAVTVKELSVIFKEESDSRRYSGVLGVTEEPIVSSDIIGDTRASVVDLPMTTVVDNDMVKVVAWFDNEWGYASQVVREAARVASELTQ